jgi:hypothetical protein
MSIVVKYLPHTEEKKEIIQVKRHLLPLPKEFVNALEDHMKAQLGWQPGTFFGTPARIRVTTDNMFSLEYEIVITE